MEAVKAELIIVLKANDTTVASHVDPELWNEVLGKIVSAKIVELNETKPPEKAKNR